MSAFLKIEVENHIATVTMNRPDTRNALSYNEDFKEFLEACASFRANRDVRVVILTGADPAFCAGGNVKDMRSKKGIAAGNPVQLRDGYRTGIQEIPLALYELEVPTIAAVNGAAIGAGCDLACMCDIRIASEKAKFAESFVKLGIISGDGGAWLLPRVVGMSKAAEMTFTGDVVDAQGALESGLVSQVVAHDDLLETAKGLAARIAANPPHAVRLSKRLLREGQHTRLDTLLEMSAAFQAMSHHTEDHTEALEAMFEKRVGSYQGR